MISTVQFLTSTWEIIFIGRYIYSIGHLAQRAPTTHSTPSMTSAVASLVKGAAQTAHAHVAALLAPAQVKPGDKLPLKENVKEADATKPITLAPSGKNIFVRTICALVLSAPRPSLFTFLLLCLTGCFYVLRRCAN